MKVGIGALASVQATVDRCKQLGVERVFLRCPSFPGYEKNGYPGEDLEAAAVAYVQSLLGALGKR